MYTPSTPAYSHVSKKNNYKSLNNDDIDNNSNNSNNDNNSERSFRAERSDIIILSRAKRERSLLAARGLSQLRNLGRHK